jgi:hypothetical protein
MRRIPKLRHPTVDIALEAGRLSEKQKRIVTNNGPHIILSRTQYETCLYPLVKKFQDRCFKFSCNDYVIFQMKMFLPLCKADIQSDIIENAIDLHCNHQTPVCGIH